MPLTRVGAPPLSVAVPTPLPLSESSLPSMEAASTPSPLSVKVTSMYPCALSTVGAIESPSAGLERLAVGGVVSGVPPNTKVVL